MSSEASQPRSAAAHRPELHGPEAELPRQDGGERRRSCSRASSRRTTATPRPSARATSRRSSRERSSETSVRLAAAGFAQHSPSSPFRPPRRPRSRCGAWMRAPIRRSARPSSRRRVRRSPPIVTENGQPVVGLEATNLAQGKSVVLAIDRSQSMKGKPLGPGRRGCARVRRRQSRRATGSPSRPSRRRPLFLTGFSPDSLG